jgi:hypothetical protein
MFRDFEKLRRLPLELSTTEEWPVTRQPRALNPSLCLIHAIYRTTLVHRKLQRGRINGWTLEAVNEPKSVFPVLPASIPTRLTAANTITDGSCRRHSTAVKQAHKERAQ